MRARALVLLAAVLVLGGVLSVPSTAQSPARATASATLATGTPGRIGTLRSAGDGRRSKAVEANVRGVRVASGELVVQTSRAGGTGSARASASARSVDVFDGLVTAYGVRQESRARSGVRTVTGRVSGLKIGGRTVGDVTTTRTYELPGGAGMVTANRGGVGLVVRLSQATNGYPAGSRVAIATVRATGTDGRAGPSPTPTATATPRPTATPDRERARERARAARARAAKARREKAARAKRRKGPSARKRLTAGGYAFPVYARDARVADDWGASRQIGAHQGNDVFAAFGAPVLAVADGELFKVGTLPISGNRLWLRSKAGDEFFYAHLSAFSPAAVNGREVEAGDVLGFTGNTGDAEPTPPHVHFEIHPGGGDAIDPHEILLDWQRRDDVKPGAFLTRYGTDTAQRPGALVEVRDFIAGE